MTNTKIAVIHLPNHICNAPNRYYHSNCNRKICYLGKYLWQPASNLSTMLLPEGADGREGERAGGGAGGGGGSTERWFRIACFRWLMRPPFNEQSLETVMFAINLIKQNINLYFLFNQFNMK